MTLRVRTGVMGRGLPRVPPPGGTTLPTGTAQGQMLFWNVATQSFVLTAAPSDGEVFIYESASGLVVPRPPAIWLAFGAQGTVSSASPTFLWPYNENTTSQAAEVTVGVNPLLPAGTLKQIVVIHGNPTGATVVPYVAVLNGAPSLLTVSLSSGVQGPVSASVDVAVAANSRLSVTGQQASGGSLLTRTVALILFQPS